eukprot:COSAG06_NODE_34831_length_468_cov_2.430894_2_plen_36_part_01
MRTTLYMGGDRLCAAGVYQYFCGAKTDRECGEREDE